MTPELRALYQKRILELNARPQNFGPLPGHTHEGFAHNSLCGDTVTLRLRVEAATIVEARFEGNGCAVSRASASLLTMALTGLPVAEAERIAHELRAFLTRAPGAVEADRARLGELTALEGVREVPARLRCATLPAEAVEAALAR